MNKKKEIKLLTQILDLESVKVYSSQEYKGIGIILQVELSEKEGVCERCGQKSQKLHQNHRHIIKDLPWGEKLVFLEINRRQFKCEKCKKPFSEKLKFMEARRSYTKRLANKTIEEVLADDISGVARKGVVTQEEIERMLKDAASLLLKAKPVGLKRLGIDEIALIKGQGNYCAVLVDLDRGQPIAMLESRKQSDIEEVLKGWGEEVLDRIEEVSIDLWKGYKAIAEKLIPNAQVVADRFHVMMQVNRELDNQRKKEKREVEKRIRTAKTQKDKAENEVIRSGIKASKYALLKNEKDLSEEQKKKLIEVKNVSTSLKIMHELKEKFRKIFEQSDRWITGLFKLGIWLSRAKKYFPTSYGTIVRWLDEIISYFDRRTTSGVVEGINNKLKLIKRSAYGFTNFNNFRNRCLLSWHFNC